MNEREKLEEARFRYSRMHAEIANPTNFKHEVNAFLASARSVLQYACEEAKTKPKGQAWYDGQVSSKPIIKFLRDKRDLTIHTQPVRPREDHTLTVGDVARASASASVVITYVDGRPSERRDVPAEPQGDPIDPPLPTHEISYFFKDWPGKEDVVTLCMTYLTEIEQIVENGIHAGFITG